MPPYKLLPAIISSPNSVIPKRVSVSAACPEETARAPVPPSISAILFSKASKVGFEIREYICPVSFKAKRFAACSVSLNTKDVV